METETITLKPIGVFTADARYKYEQPRQGSVDGGGVGEVILDGGSNFEQALEDLAGFDRVWLLYHFHHNADSWRTKAAPPVPPPGKPRVGLFASRSPYRPNPIGLSCVRLISIMNRTLTVAEADLLDGTPILDIKPYIPAFDAFPHARAGWLEDQVRSPYALSFSEAFRVKADWLRAHAGLDAESVARVQLSINPFATERKRVRLVGEGRGILSYRTWRIDFSFDREGGSIVADDLRSGWSPEELAGGTEDPYGDKEMHRDFLREGM